MTSSTGGAGLADVAEHAGDRVEELQPAGVVVAGAAPAGSAGRAG